MESGKLSRSECGRLGAEKSKHGILMRALEFRKSYRNNPNYCNWCNKPLAFEKRKNTFCSHSCSACVNNLGVRRHGEAHKQCIECGNRVNKNAEKYCSVGCQQRFEYKTYIEKWLRGEITGTQTKNPEPSNYIRRWLFITQGDQCKICGVKEWMGQKVPLVIDHIDGDSSNNKDINLRLVCGNCDMQLPTYKSKNKNSARGYRRKRYAEGKSY